MLQPCLPPLLAIGVAVGLTVAYGSFDDVPNVNALASACTPPADLYVDALQLKGPASTSDYTTWLEKMKAFRKKCLAAVNPSGNIFAEPALKWTQTAYMQPLMMPFDRSFYDGSRYTVDKYLETLRSLYGDIDAVLVWPTYTNIGADDRNQFDMIRSMPSGFIEAVAELHKRGIQVILPYNPWDQGTAGGDMRNSSAASQADANRLAALLASTASDGFFGDTISSGGLEEFYKASVKAGRPAAIQPEAGGTPSSLNYTTMSWGYWNKGYTHVPPVDLMKWLEPRWLTQVCDRWSRDKNDFIQLAFFNGDGVETWQSIWGIWNGMTDFDSEVLKRVGTILRFFGHRGFLQSTEWQPHTPTLQAASGIFASAWPVGDETLWTFVNRGSGGCSGAQLSVPESRSRQFYNCYTGERVVPDVVGTHATLSFAIEKDGYGCVFATANHSLDAETTLFLSQMRELTQKPLSSYSKAWSPLPQQMVNLPRTPLSTEAPDGMVDIPGVSGFHFVVSGVEIEGGPQESVGGVDVQYPWESTAHIHHDQHLNISRFFMDRTPVTRSAYRAYLDASGYKPQDESNFLKNWTKLENGSWVFPSGSAKKPATYVSLAEARAFCAFHKKRLPHSYEWQYAAQGMDGRMYPWGSKMDASHCPPLVTDSNVCPGPADVDAFEGVSESPFGVLDLVGNVWQFTDEFVDAHTRAAIVRGGSNYYPSVPHGTNWYFPNGPNLRQLNLHGKYMLMSDSYERAGTVGFRCVSDANPSIVVI